MGQLCGEGNLAVFVSYPKSGRTWVRYFLHLRGVEVEFTHAGTGSEGSELGRRLKRTDTSLADTHRIVFMHRNPIDTTVSLYFQVHKKELIRGSARYLKRYPRYLVQRRLPPPDMSDFMFHPGYGVEKVCRFNANWLKRLKTHRDKLIMSYEAAQADVVSEFSNLLGFLRADPRDIEKTIEASSFAQMQKVEQSGAVEFDWLRVGIAGDQDSAKARRGKICGYADYLDAGTIDRCRAIAADYGFDA